MDKHERGPAGKAGDGMGTPEESLQTAEDGAGGAATEGRLTDGRTIRYRPIRAGDAPWLQSLHRRLSRETTRLRFFSPMPRLNDAMASHFAQVDFEDRGAFVAHFPGEDDVRAVGRYEREGPHSAEVAFVVEDSLQGLGIGKHLLILLAAHARKHGFERFTAITLAENQGMLSVFRGCGYPVEVLYSGETAHVKIDIREKDVARKAPRSLLPNSSAR